MRSMALCTLALVSVVVAACGVLGPEDEPSELDRNRELWQNAALTNYGFALEQLCFCGETARGPVRLQVVGGVATSRTYVSSGEAVPAVFEESFPTVEGLFDILRDAIDRDAFRIDVTYADDVDPEELKRIREMLDEAVA